jgi:hypothetical protein
MMQQKSRQSNSGRLKSRWLKSRLVRPLLGLTLVLLVLAGCVVVTDPLSYRYYFYNRSSFYIHIESSEGDFYLHPQTSYYLDSYSSTIRYNATVIGASGSVHSEKDGNAIYFYDSWWY